VAVAVVAGQTRGVGKTSVMCGLMAAMPEREWTAVKVSVHGHEEGVEVCEETSAGSGKDSERYLAAGAVRSFYISVPANGLWRAIPRLLDILAEARDAMVESASVLEYLRPEVALAVIDPSAGEVKESLQRCFERIDAVVTTGSGPLGGAFLELEAKARFVVRPPVYGSEALTAFVREALGK
jgi:hypothetical protein